MSLQDFTLTLCDFCWQIRKIGPLLSIFKIRISLSYLALSVYRVLVGKLEVKRPLGRTRRRWEDNIKMDLQKVGCGGLDWIELAEDRDRRRGFVNAVMNLRVP
jgi:hypothetical protein